MRPLTRQLPALLLAALVAGACAGTTPFQGMNLQEVYDVGLQKFEEEEWDDAIEAFETVLFGAPTAEEVPSARWYLAEAHHRRGEHVTAASEFNRFLERFPTHDLAPAAALGVCRAHEALSPIIQRDQTDTREAHTACSNAAQDYGGTPEADDAAEIADRMWRKLAEKVFVGGEFYFTRRLYDSAILYYEDVVQSYPDTPTAPRALRRMHEAYEAIGYTEEADEARERLLQEYPESESARQIQGQASTGR